MESPEKLKELTHALTTSVNTFLAGTWRIKPDDYRLLEYTFGLFLNSMKELSAFNSSPEEQEKIYSASLEQFCTLHGKNDQFATKEWLERFSSIAHKCLPKPQKESILTDDDALNEELAICFHFVLPDSWIEVLVDAAVRTDPLQIHRYFCEEITVQENPQFFKV